jgi:ATP-dependent DNA ligase
MGRQCQPPPRWRGPRLPVDQRDLAALACKMIGSAAAKDACAYDDDFHAMLHAAELQNTVIDRLAQQQLAVLPIALIEAPRRPMPSAASMVCLGAPCMVCHAPPMARQSKLPKALQPMLATLVDAPFDGRDWVFESKWDGFRIGQEAD